MTPDAGTAGRAPMVCREFVEVVTGYLEAALPPAEHDRAETHLAGCDGCHAYLAQMRATIGILRRLAGRR